MKVRTIHSIRDRIDQIHPENGDYTVYAMEIYHDYQSELIEKGNIIYIIETSIGLRGYNSQYFEVLDSRISHFWNFNIGTGFCELGVDIWVGNPDFQSKIMYDNDGQSVAFFESHKMNMDLEFRDENLQSVMSIENNWVKCCNCENIWENYSLLGKVLCPSCGYRMNNLSVEIQDSFLIL